MSWSTTKTGNLFHDFTPDGIPACGVRGTQGYGQSFKTLEAAQERAAAWRVGSLRNNVKVCPKCEAKEMAARERLAASLEPSTGEGDYLPPAKTAAKITPEVIHALRNIRAFAQGERRDVSHEINILDNAGIFAAIDEATGYDVDPEPERVSKCTCAPGWERGAYHKPNCPGDPAEWGDMAFTTAPASGCTCPPSYAANGSHDQGCPTVRPERRPCPADDCTLSFRVRSDGTLRQHLNDNLRPCPGVAPAGGGIHIGNKTLEH